MGVDVSLEGDVDVNVNMDDTFLLDMWWLGLTLAMGFVLKYKAGEPVYFHGDHVNTNYNHRIMPINRKRGPKIVKSLFADWHSKESPKQGMCETPPL